MRVKIGILVTALMLSALTGCRTKEEKTQETVTVPEATVQADEKTSELEIDLPHQDDLVADYTTVSGLHLEPGTHIAVVVKNPKTNYWKAVEKGMKQAVKEINEELGYSGDDAVYFTYEGPDDESNAEVQINTIDAVLAENPQVLCLAAIDMNSCEAQLETAQENGIPVIILDSGVRSNDLVYTVCETDNYSAARQAAQKLCEQIGDAGKIQIMAHEQISETCVKRENGFRDEIAENHPNVTLLETIYSDGEEDADALLKESVAANPDLKGIFTTNEAIGVKVLSLIEKEKLSVSLVGFDAGEVQLQAIRDGKECGVICQNPYGMGYATIIAGARAILGMTNDEHIDAGYQWIDASNIDNEENQKYLYE